jgi:hypothetical protein
LGRENVEAADWMAPMTASEQLELREHIHIDKAQVIWPRRGARDTLEHFRHGISRPVWLY